MNEDELFAGLAGLEAAREVGASDGITASQLINGIEYARVDAAEERRIRAAWKRRRGGGATPLVLVAGGESTEGTVRVLGPDGDGPLRTLRAESLLDVARRSVTMRKLEAAREVAREIDRLSTEGLPGLVVKGLGTEHLYVDRLRGDETRWSRLTEETAGLATTGWREVLEGLGYTIEQLPRYGYVAKVAERTALVIHPQAESDAFARMDESGRLPEGALAADCAEHGAPYGILAAGSRMRLLAAGSEEGGATTRYLELDPAVLGPGELPLTGLLAPRYLDEGELDLLLTEARRYGGELRRRLDTALRQRVLPVLGVELGRWAEADGLDLRDESVRADLEAAAMTFVFRALFLLYAESAGHLPMANSTYAQRSFTRICERAAEEGERADPGSTSLWRDAEGLVEAMRVGQSAWGVPAYNGALFSASGFAGAETLESASIPDAALAPALVALARDPAHPEVGLDFSGLEIGHLGHIYEGLLSLRLSLADRDFAYDPDSDRYVEPEGEAEIEAGQLLWLTDEGGRKGGGVYYTRAELVRHLIRESVRPAFAAHLERVAAVAERQPGEAAKLLFDFYVLDPACGSAHFLVEVVDELADQIATFLARTPLPSVRAELEGLRASAGRTYGVAIEDSALLKRLVLKRSVFGIDLSPMGAEIAKVSLWLASFVPGLSLAYLDHNIQEGNSLIGVARPEDVRQPGAEVGQSAMFGDALGDAILAAASKAAELRRIEDRSPEEVQESIDVHRALRREVADAERVLDLWTAEPLGLAGARDAALTNGGEILDGQPSLLAEQAGKLAAEHHFLHWPLAFAEAFARDRPGFDVVVGNPPWEEVNVEELGFFARYKPGIRSLSERRRKVAVEALRVERPELETKLERERKSLAMTRSALVPANGYPPMPGNADLYKFFCQRYRALLREGGMLGVVLPRSVFVAKGSAGFRQWLFDNAAPRRIDFILNSGRWAFDAEPRYTIALLAAQRVAADPDAKIDVAGVAASDTEFARQSDSPGLGIGRSALGPALEVPLLPDQDAADLLTKLRRGEPFPFGGGRWRCFPVQGDLNETTDAHFWEGARSGLPLWKGGSFDQFDPNGADERRCPESAELRAKIEKPRPGSGSLLAEAVPTATRHEAVIRELARPRLAFRDVSRATDTRTVRACIVPADCLLTNKAPYLAFLDEDPANQAACLGLMNSFVFDWQARRFVETNLNFFVLEGLRLPRLDDDSFAALVRTAGRLSCVDDRFAALAEQLGVECGELGDDEADLVWAELDAVAAHAYGLTVDELDVVFADFTDDAAPDEYRQLVRDRLTELR